MDPQERKLHALNEKISLERCRVIRENLIQKFKLIKKIFKKRMKGNFCIKCFYPLPSDIFHRVRVQSKSPFLECKNCRVKFRVPETWWKKIGRN